MTAGQYRSRSLAGCVVAFSVAYERDNLLARGMGWEHLRGLLLCLARLMLRHSADLAYGGNWKKTDDNFLFPLLDLICAEQEDEGLGIKRDNGSDLSEPDANPHVSKLYNHLAWPWYLDVTPTLEAQWVNCCRIVRVRQQDAGFLEADIVADGDTHPRRDTAISIQRGGDREQNAAYDDGEDGDPRSRCTARNRTSRHRAGSALRQGGTLFRLSARNIRGSARYP